MMLGLARSFLLSATTRRFAERCGWRSALAEERGSLASRTSMTRSETLRRWRMARVAAAMWPGNQVMAPPPALNAMSPKPNPFLSNSFNPDILLCSAPSVNFAVAVAAREFQMLNLLRIGAVMLSQRFSFGLNPSPFLWAASSCTSFFFSSCTPSIIIFSFYPSLKYC